MRLMIGGEGKWMVEKESSLLRMCRCFSLVLFKVAKVLCRGVHLHLFEWTMYRYMSSTIPVRPKFKGVVTRVFGSLGNR